MSKKEEVEGLKDRVRKVREKLDGQTIIKPWAAFRNENPDLDINKVRNVYYYNSTDEEITQRLEAFLEKYRDIIEGGQNG